MRVIGAGCGRTGTTSAAAALDVLGFGPCVQMQTMWEQPALAEVWAAHQRGETADWPDAKVLLTLRDAPSWYKSVLGSIHAWPARGQEVGPPPVEALLDRVWDQPFGGWSSVFDRDHTLARYDAHVADVRRDCPPDRLVEWHVADGWAPSCDALGVEVPDRPVPHLNRRPA